MYSSKQWRPRWNAAWCSISSGSTLFARTKMIFRERKLIQFLFGNFNLWSLDIYNGPSQVYIISNWKEESISALRVNQNRAIKSIKLIFPAVDTTETSWDINSSSSLLTCVTNAEKNPRYPRQDLNLGCWTVSQTCHRKDQISQGYCCVCPYSKICLIPGLDRLSCSFFCSMTMDCTITNPPYVWPAKAQISLRICTLWSEPLQVTWIFYDW